MVMEIVIRAPANEGIVLAQVTITSQYENLIIPMRVSVAHGRLEVVPRQIVLDDCFPVNTTKHSNQCQARPVE